MRFRLGITVGFGAGYYFGSKAGRDRYRQLQGWIDKLRGTELVETAAGKAKAVVELGVERARDVAERRSGGADRPSAGEIDLRDLDEGTTIPLVEVSPAANGIGG